VSDAVHVKQRVKKQTDFQQTKKKLFLQLHTLHWKNMMESLSAVCVSIAKTRHALLCVLLERLQKQKKVRCCMMKTNVSAAVTACKHARSKFRGMNGQVTIRAFANVFFATNV
jgi:hypothetical protein